VIANDGSGIARWKELYQRALTEVDPLKMPAAIGGAHKAILERIGETLTRPNGPEQLELNDALNQLRTLRNELNRRVG